MAAAMLMMVAAVAGVAHGPGASAQTTGSDVVPTAPPPTLAPLVTTAPKAKKTKVTAKATTTVATTAAPTTTEAPTTLAPTTTAPGPTTSLTASNSVIPGTTEATTTDDPAQKHLRLIIAGLFILAGVILVVTGIFWYRTRPKATVAVPEAPPGPEPPAKNGPTPAPEPAAGGTPTIPEQLRHVPLWADDPPAPGR